MTNNYEFVVYGHGHYETDWCMYDQCEVKTWVDDTTVVVVASSKEQAIHKIEKRYPGKHYNFVGKFN